MRGKGIVERNNEYLETSFLPGRSFASPADFNAQLGEWTLLANSRFKRALGCAPAGRIDADRAAIDLVSGRSAVRSRSPAPGGRRRA
jgi:hypothetical protein